MICVRIGFLLSLAVPGWGAEPLVRLGQMTAPGIVEASGVVASRRHPGIFWTHNDSGNPPELFAVRRDGTLVRSYRVAAANVDWEDIATDDSGNLYIGDIGNNKLVLPIRAILKISEPDPTDSRASTEPLRVSTSYFYKYPSSGRFDAEGLVVIDDQALLVTKRRDGNPAEVFRLPLDRPASLVRPLEPDRLSVLPGCVEAVTGASWNATKRLLAVVTDRSVRIYQPAPDLAAWQQVGLTIFEARDVEAVTWDQLDLILASEDRSIYQIPERRWRTGR